MNTCVPVIHVCFSFSKDGVNNLSWFGLGISQAENSKQPHYEMNGVQLFLDTNRPFSASHSRGTKPPSWRGKVALGQDKQKTYIILNGNFLCLSCPSATFTLQHVGFCTT